MKWVRERALRDASSQHGQRGWWDLQDECGPWCHHWLFRGKAAEGQKDLFEVRPLAPSEKPEKGNVT